MTCPPVLITGAPGWLGTKLVLAIAQGLPDVPGMEEGLPGRAIRCLVKKNRDASVLEAINGPVELVAGDLTDPVSLKDFCREAEGAVLFHAAGLIHPLGRVKEFYQVNAEGTGNLIKAAANAGVKRFIHVSSNSPFGFNPDRDKRFDESSPYNPYLNYGRSKKMAEDIINTARAEGAIETVIIRPPWFYGPGHPPRQSRFFSMIKRGRAPIVGNGENLRSMAYLDNICQALLLCERAEAADGQTYWIADRTPYTMNRIVNTAARVMEDDFGISVSPGRLRLPGIVSEAAMWVDGLIQGVGRYWMDVHVLSELNRNIAVKIDKAEKELGYDPKIELEEGMRRSIKWMMDKGMEF